VKFKDDGIAACVTGDTIVETREGGKRIDSLVGTTGELFSVDGKGKKICAFNSVSLTRYKQKIYNIKTIKGIIRCTGDHKILTEKGWKRADELTREDKIARIDS
jgi:replicative DNA helicase